METSFELEIDDLASSGEGVGKHQGFTIFVDGALPTERVLVRIIEEKKNYAKARLEKILRSSKDRVKPICPKFEVCGGCQLMHLNYDGQLKIKERRVKDAFIRIGRIQNFTIDPCVGSENPLGYRNKIQLPVSAGNKIGLYAKRSHEIIPIETCLIHNREGEKIVEQIKQTLNLHPISIYNEKTGRGELRHLLIKTAKSTGKVLVALITTTSPTKELKKIAKHIYSIDQVVGVVHGFNDKRTNAVRAESYKVLEGEYALEERLLGIDVCISPQSFFQVNPPQAEKIYQKAFALAEIQRSDRVFDAYCGIGLFTCFLAQHSDQVIGVEIVAGAIADARKNAQRNHVTVNFICGKVEEEIGKLPKQDVVFLNPPRKGCERIVLESLAQMDPKKIIYTSCDEATLARDAAILAELGYDQIFLYPFDMFPQTMHVEIVTLFIKNSS